MAEIHLGKLSCSGAEIYQQRIVQYVLRRRLLSHQ